MNKNLNMEEISEVVLYKLTVDKNNLKEEDWGMDRIQVKLVKDYVNTILTEIFGLEVDDSSLTHKFGIGNNNKWNIVDDDRVICQFYCNTDMFGGVFIGFTNNDDTINKIQL